MNMELSEKIISSLTQFFMDHRGSEPTKLIMSHSFYYAFKHDCESELKYSSKDGILSIAGYPIEVIDDTFPTDNFAPDFKFKWVRMLDAKEL